MESSIKTGPAYTKKAKKIHPSITVHQIKYESLSFSIHNDILLFISPDLDSSQSYVHGFHASVIKQQSVIWYKKNQSNESLWKNDATLIREIVY